MIHATSRGPGTIYPVLERLEQSGWLVSSWEPPSERRGPRRRLYRLTPEGASSAAAVLAITDATVRSAEPLKGATA
nr:PadR family transcriptional regulator [Amnibacterium kyonggiense]